MSLDKSQNDLRSPTHTEITESARKRMRLDNTPRSSWSLIDKRTDQETLQEMGVSLLEPDDADAVKDLESPSLLKAGSKRKHNTNRENVNPNVNSAPNSASKLSPKRSPKAYSPVAGPSCSSGYRTLLSEAHIQDTLSSHHIEEETPQRVSCALSPKPRSPKGGYITPRTCETGNVGHLQSTKETPTKHGPPHASAGGVDSFATLSDEVMLGIFKWLPKRTLMHCMLVCKRWHRIASDETFWQRLELGNKTINKGALGKILAKKPIIIRLAASEIGEWHSTEPIEQTRIQFLDLSMCSVDTNTLQCLLARCIHLRKLSLESVPLDDATCSRVGECTKLETLNVTMATGITYDGLNDILDGCTSLQSLNISWCNLSQSSLKLLGRKAPANLLRLNIAGARIMTDDILSQIITRCPRLLELDASDCPKLTGTSITRLTNGLTRLEHLALSRCYLLPPHALTKLNAMPSLQYLEVWGMLADASLAALRTALQHIQLNQFMHSAIARPTVGTRRTSIWGLRTRD